MTTATTTLSPVTRRSRRLSVLSSSVIAAVLFAACAVVTAGYTRGFVSELERFENEQQRLNAVSRQHVTELRATRVTAHTALTGADVQSTGPSVIDQS